MSYDCLATSPRTDALLCAACEVVPGGVHSARRVTVPPLCARSARGAYIEDVDGRMFVDYNAGCGAVILGHGDEEIVDRAAAAAKRCLLVGIGTTESELELAQKVVEHVPSVEQVLFCGSGSEATFNAIRLARAVTGRSKILKFDGCYHGSFDYVLLNVHSRPVPLGRRVPESAGEFSPAVDATIVCRFNDLDDVAEAFNSNVGEIAAVIVEPVAHNAPGIMPRPGFLEGLRGLCDRERALLIFDEVITGFRHHIGGYQAVAGVMPDVTTLGKAMANGFPIAAVGGRRTLMSRFMTRDDGDVAWGGTYAANGLAVAAALATIARLEDGEVYRHIFALGEIMRAGLEELVARTGVPATVCGYGSIFSLCFVDHPLRSYDDLRDDDVDLFLRYRRGLMARGVFEVPDVDGYRSHISAAHSEPDVERSLKAAEESLEAALGRR